MTLKTPVLLVSCLLLEPSGTEPLGVLIQQYSRAKGNVRKAKNKEAAMADVAEILDHIADVDTKASLLFLARELEKAPAPFAAACATPMLRSTREEAPRLLLRGLSRSEKEVRIGVLRAIGGSEHGFTALGPALAAAAREIDDPEEKLYLPPILERFDNVEAYSALLAQVRHSEDPRKRTREAAPRVDLDLNYQITVRDILAASESPDVKRWLAAEAFTEAANRAQLYVVAHAAGELKIHNARKHLEDLIGNEFVEVAAVALDALVSIGLAGSVNRTAAQLHIPQGDARDVYIFRVRALDALAATATEPAMRAVLRHARGGDPKLRKIALGSLAPFKEHPDALECVLQALKDADPDTRAVALRTLRNMRHRSMVEPLIDFLEAESIDRLRVEALKMLMSLTGHNMGLVVADWRKWWDAAAAGFQPVSTGAPRNTVTTTKIRNLSYFGIDVASKQIAFLVDVSGSMAEVVDVYRVDVEGDGANNARTKVRGRAKKRRADGGSIDTEQAKKIDVLKKELRRVIENLPKGTKINIVSFEADFRPWKQKLQTMSAGGKRRAVRHVMGLQANGGTNVFDTLEFALSDSQVDTIYLLTDGEPTAGRFKEPNMILEQVALLNRLRAVSIHCIAFGQPSALLEALAHQNGGEYRFVDTY